MTPGRIRQAAGAELPGARRLLFDLIRCPSTPGREREAMRRAQAAFRACGARVTRVPLPEALREDPDYCDPIPGLRYRGRFNVRAMRPGTGGGPTVLFNTHLDVVPPSEGMASPWTPRRKGDAVAGRGACDAKGQAATLWLVFRILQRLGLSLRGDLVAHLVAEEENGGNGTLAMVRRGERADACVVLEPTGERVMSSVRGAVWFRLECAGRAGHSGRAGPARSALLLARDAMAALEGLQARMLESSRGLPLFDAHPNPMPITFGSLQAGHWPASAPGRAVLTGVLGFLPNRTHRRVQAEMRAALREALGPAALRRISLSFPYRHDASVLDPGHALPQALLRAAGRQGAPAGLAGMTASCDAVFYRKRLGLPTVVYGPGSLQDAHSPGERIDLRAVARAAAVLTEFLLDYCGRADEGAG